MRWIICATVFMASAAAWGQTTQPSPEQLLNQMLRPTDNDKSVPLQPTPDAAAAATTSQASTSEAAPAGILREGTDLVDRVGRLQKGSEGDQEEFVFEADGRALRDPPVVILPNLKLMSMETAVSNSSHDLRFRITGTVTEYHGRNYILLEKVVVVQDKDQEF
jgi:hypothetical protein